jgi:hypothetical protein
MWHASGFPFGWTELLITLGFIATFLRSYLSFVGRFPVPTQGLEARARASGEHDL